MVRVRRGVVVEAARARAGLIRCVVECSGERADAIAYDDLTGPVEAGDSVVLNTTAVALGLGTGGFHIVMAVEGREPGSASGNAMKLRYTPSQTSVNAVEDEHRSDVDAVDSLLGMPVIAAGLHSALAPAVIGVRCANPRARIAYVMTDAAALHCALSDSVAALKEKGLIDVVITSGQSTGGDLESVSLAGALAAAKAVARAHVVIVAMGPGNLGTGSRWGFASIEVSEIVNLAAAMRGRPIVAPRISFADKRARHTGVSHHTITALGLALARADVPIHAMPEARARAVREALAPLAHDVIVIDLGDEVERALSASPVALRSMGRRFEDDPDCFRAAAAAGVHAARMLSL